MTPRPSPAPNPASERLYCLRREHCLDRDLLTHMTDIRPGDILTAETVDPSVLTAPEWNEHRAVMDGLRAFKSKTGIAWQFVRDPVTDTITF